LIKEALHADRFSNENFVAQDNVTPSQWTTFLLWPWTLSSGN